MISVGIVGGTGYTGSELMRLLAQHPGARVEVLTSRKEAGQRADAMFPNLRGHVDISFSAPDPARLAECDVVFYATPHGVAMQDAVALLDRGVRVIDLSADFRLRDPLVFRHWYHLDHAAPALLEEAVYGLPEMNRSAIEGARLVANPGCYPTAVQLAVMPLLRSDRATVESVIADCKSGVSGAGREAKLGSLFCETADNFKAYGVSGHRHAPEIEQGLADMAGRPVATTFVPHLLPLVRGIHATVYLRLDRPVSDLQTLYEAAYAAEPFVDVLPAGAHPETRHVRAVNTCRMAVHQGPDPRTVIVLSVIDNLVKGAAGQAVQNMNLMFGLDERCGLDAVPLSP
jgi:N-acetyl-gamma-glutamyl-phosphate reductase